MEIDLIKELNYACNSDLFQIVYTMRKTFSCREGEVLLF